MDSHEEHARDFLLEKVDLFCANPPYNVRADQNRSYSNCDVLKKIGMEDMVLVVQDVLRKDGHGHGFCLELLFGYWYNQLRQMTETVQEPGVVADDEDEPTVLKELQVDEVALKYPRAPRN